MACERDEVALHHFSSDPWFAGLPEPLQACLLDLASSQRLEPRQALTHGGDTTSGIVGLAERAAMVYPAIGPAEAGPIHLLLAPLWFGLLPISRNRPRAVSVIAQSPCLVARVSRQRVLQLLGQNPGWWQHMHDLALSNFLVAAQAAVDLHINDSRQRLCAVLLRLGNCRHGGNCKVDLPISQQDLAAIANMSRQTVGQILKFLAAAGLVTWRYRSIALVDPAGLRQLADAEVLPGAPLATTG